MARLLGSSSGCLTAGVLSSYCRGGALSHLLPQSVGVRWHNGQGSGWLPRGRVLGTSPHSPECVEPRPGAQSGHDPPRDKHFEVMGMQRTRDWGLDHLCLSGCLWQACDPRYSVSQSVKWGGAALGDCEGLSGWSGVHRVPHCRYFRRGRGARRGAARRQGTQYPPCPTHSPAGTGTLSTCPWGAGRPGSGSSEWVLGGVRRET